MKKIKVKIGMSIFLILTALCFSSCSVRESNSINDIKGQEKQVSEQTGIKVKMSYKADELKNYTKKLSFHSDTSTYTTVDLDQSQIKKIKIDSIENFTDCSAVFLNEDTMFIGFYSEKGTCKFYKYEVKNGKATLIYEENDFVPCWIFDARAIVLKGGNIVFVGNKEYIIFDKETLKVVDRVTYPKELKIDSISISPDGDKLIYKCNEGLYLSSMKFQNPQLLIKTTGEGERVKAAKNIKWFDDNKKISYMLCGYEWSEGFGVMNLDGTDNCFFSCKELMDYNIKGWMADNKRLLCEMGLGDYSYGILDISTNKFKKLPIEKGLCSCGNISPSGNILPLLKDGSFYLLDLEKKEEYLVYKNKLEINNLFVDCWAPSENRLLFRIDEKKGNTYWCIAQIR